jgi:hypothetical protein
MLNRLHVKYLYGWKDLQRDDVHNPTRLSTHTSTNTHARARNHARKHPRAGTQTEKFIIIIAFPRQKLLHDEVVTFRNFATKMPGT